MAKKECKKCKQSRKKPGKQDDRYVCNKCGLTANAEKHLCKPVKA